MRRYAARKDSVHGAIVEALRAAGASVQVLDAKDVPDLLVGYRGHNILIEVKTATTNTKKDGYTRRTRGKLSDGQRAWAAAWRGDAVAVVFDVSDVLALLGCYREWTAYAHGRRRTSRM